MARPLRRLRWLFITGAVVVLAVVAAPFLISVDRYRPLLVQVIQASTGRDVEIASLRLELWPSVRVRAANVRLKNPSGFPAGDAIEVNTVDLRVEPRALLARRLQITGIAVNGVRVNFLSDAAGRTNLDLPAPPPGTPPPGAGTAAGGRPLLALSPIGTVTVKNVDLAVGGLDARHTQTAEVFTLTGLGASVRSIDPNAPDWTQRLEITSSLKGARLSTPRLTTPVRIESGALVLRGGKGRATFAAVLDTTRATGTATVLGLDPPSFAFTVSIPDLDANRLERVLSARPGPAVGSGGGPRRLIARGEVSIDRLVFSPLRASAVRSRVSVYTDVVRADAYSLSAYGGTVQGAAALDYAAAGLPTTGTARARGIDLAQLVSVFNPRGPKITGALVADLTLATALGGDPEAALTGAGTFAIRNGSFPGLDVKNNMVRVAKLLQLNVPAGETRFSYLGGDLRIARERVYSRALRLDAEGMEGAAQGSFGFDQTLDYTGTGVLTSLASAGTPSSALVNGLAPAAGQVLGRFVPGAAGATGARVPFAISGTFGDPKFALAGTPQLLGGGASRTQSTPAVPQQPQAPGLPQLPSLQNLLNLPH